MRERLLRLSGLLARFSLGVLSRLRASKTRAAVWFSAAVAVVASAYALTAGSATYAVVASVPTVVLAAVLFTVGVLQGWDRALPVPAVALLASVTVPAAFLEVWLVQPVMGTGLNLYQLWLAVFAFASAAYLTGWAVGMSVSSPVGPAYGTSSKPAPKAPQEVKGERVEKEGKKVPLI